MYKCTLNSLYSIADLFMQVLYSLCSCIDSSTYAASSSCAFAASTCTNCCAFLTFSMMFPILPRPANGLPPPSCSFEQASWYSACQGKPTLARENSRCQLPRPFCRQTALVFAAGVVAVQVCSMHSHLTTGQVPPGSRLTCVNCSPA